ncbi:sulfite exporter TauE/SafE family protein [Porticoccaceae bacterium]|nr:sulfite exporter TauE/SafE family protein [Porticoccaceae bacterium]
MNFDLTQLATIWVVVIMASILRAFTGFGFALAAVPSLSLFLLPREAVVLSAALVLSISLINRRAISEHVAMRPLVPLMAWTVTGTVVGVLLLTWISSRWFRLTAGLAVLIACVALIARPSQTPINRGFKGLFGLTAGIMNGFLAMPGPPILIYAMLTEPDLKRTRALMHLMLMGSAILVLLSYFAVGYLSYEIIQYYLLALPIMILGDKLGNHLFQLYGAEMYRKVALLLLFTVGIAAIVSSFN